MPGRWLAAAANRAIDSSKLKQSDGCITKMLYKQIFLHKSGRDFLKQNRKLNASGECHPHGAATLTVIPWCDNEIKF